MEGVDIGRIEDIESKRDRLGRRLKNAPERSKPLGSTTTANRMYAVTKGSTTWRVNSLRDHGQMIRNIGEGEYIFFKDSFKVEVSMKEKTRYKELIV